MNFEQRTKGMQMEDLLRIATSVEADGYESEAIEAAKREIQNRNIGGSQISEISEQIEIQKFNDLNRDEIPLSNGGWLGFLLCAPIFWLSVFFVLSLYSQGYRRKGKEAIYAIIAGIFAWAILVPAVVIIMSLLFS